MASNNNFFLNGLNPLAYLGVNPYTPVPFFSKTTDPTTRDAQNFILGTIWLNTITEGIWFLVSLANGNATWVQLSAGGGGTVISLTGDDSIPVLPLVGNINVFGTPQAGSSVSFTGATPHTLKLNTTDANGNTIIGNSAGNGSISGLDNTALGFSALHDLTTGSNNVAIGESSLAAVLTGHDNIAVGQLAGDNYTGAESHNILIGNLGVLGESNAIHIGTQGTQTTAFMAGISGVSVSNKNRVTINTVTGQLGSEADPSGTITAVATANATPQFVLSGTTETVDFNLTTNLVLGSSLPSLAGGTHNVGIGQLALNSLTSGVNNTAVGYNAGTAITTGSNNMIYGDLAGRAITTGSDNISMGFATLGTMTTGSSNTAIGAGAGSVYTGAESNNILLGNVGVLGESNTIHIGATQTSAYMSGVYGVTPANPTQFVIVDSVTGQLGSTAGTPGSTGNSIIAISSPVSNFTAPKFFSISSLNQNGVASSALANSVVPIAGTLSNLYVNVISNASTSNDTFTLYKNNSATSLVVTITALTTGVFSDTTHSVAVVAGDLICFNSSQSTTANWSGQVTCNLNA
jgi:hypothetical protein